MTRFYRSMSENATGAGREETFRTQRGRDAHDVPPSRHSRLLGDEL